MSREPVHVTVWEEGADPKSAVLFVHGSTCWGTDPLFGFCAQRPLSDSYRLLVMDRRGYGHSPEIDRSDYAIDAEDIVELLGHGAHLVGHSYGGVGAMLAAAAAPERVLSLVLIEPGCYQVARDHPVIADALDRNRKTLEQIPSEITDAEYLEGVADAIDMPRFALTPDRLRAAHAGRHERPCWEAAIPVHALRAGPYPKTVLTGTWANAPAAYRRLGGEPLTACAQVTAERIGARLVTIADASHFSHAEQPIATNAALADIFESQTL